MNVIQITKTIVYQCDQDTANTIFHEIKKSGIEVSDRMGRCRLVNDEEGIIFFYEEDQLLYRMISMIGVFDEIIEKHHLPVLDEWECTTTYMVL